MSKDALKKNLSISYIFVLKSVWAWTLVVWGKKNFLFSALYRLSDKNHSDKKSKDPTKGGRLAVSSIFQVECPSPMQLSQTKLLPPYRVPKWKWNLEWNGVEWLKMSRKTYSVYIPHIYALSGIIIIPLVWLTITVGSVGATMKNHLQFCLSICENYKKYAYVEYFGKIICKRPPLDSPTLPSPLGNDVATP